LGNLARERQLGNLGLANLSLEAAVWELKLGSFGLETFALLGNFYVGALT